MTFDERYMKQGLDIIHIYADMISGFTAYSTWLDNLLDKLEYSLYDFSLDVAIKYHKNKNGGLACAK